MKLKYVILLCMLSSCSTVTMYDKPYLNLPYLDAPIMETITQDNMIQAMSNNLKKMQIYSLNQKAMLKSYKDYYEPKKVVTKK